MRATRWRCARFPCTASRKLMTGKTVVIATGFTSPVSRYVFVIDAVSLRRLLVLTEPRCLRVLRGTGTNFSPVCRGMRSFGVTVAPFASSGPFSAVLVSPFHLSLLSLPLALTRAENCDVGINFHRAAKSGQNQGPKDGISGQIHNTRTRK